MVKVICTICQQFLDDSNYIFATPCCHFFHKNCLANRLSRSSECPRCQSPIEPGAARQVYLHFTDTDSNLMRRKNNLKVLQTKLRKKQEETRRLKALSLKLDAEIEKDQTELAELEEKSKELKFACAKARRAKAKHQQKHRQSCSSKSQGQRRQPHRKCRKELPGGLFA